MKPQKKYNVGDKVFAKVKGYPPWPAKVMEEHGKKYNVRFYGTGETGLIKVEDIFYYNAYKSKFVKGTKRKDYRDAVEEIETDIIEEGGDGSGENTAVIPDIKTNTETNTQTNRSRKRSHSSVSDKSTDESSKTKVRRVISGAKEESDVSEDANKENEKTTTNSEVQKRFLQQNDVPIPDEAGEVPQVSESESADSDAGLEQPTESSGLQNGTTLMNYTFISEKYLTNVKEYANFVQDKLDLYKDKPVETREDDCKLLATKLPSGKYVGIKFKVDEPVDVKSEAEMAKLEADEAQKILDLMTALQDGKTKVEEVSDQIIDFKESPEEIEATIKLQTVNKKRYRYECFRAETRLLALDAKIRSSLGLDKAYPTQALECLELLLELPLQVVMLKKHPHVVDMIKRLRRYRGNVTEWQMEGEELEKFNENASKIRDKADEVFTNFKELSGISSKNFWDEFNKSVEEFKKQTQNMEESRFFSLLFEPNSRQDFLSRDDASSIKPEDIEKGMVECYPQNRVNDEDNSMKGILGSTP